MGRAEHAMDGIFASLLQAYAPELLPELTDRTGRDLTGFKMESAKGTGSDRKVAKAAIRGTLGPRNYAPHP